MSTTARSDVLLVIRAKETAAQAIDAASDAMRKLFETQQDVASGSKLTGNRLAELIENIKKVEQAYSTIDGAAAKADAAFTRQQQKLTSTRAELEAITKQIEGAARAIEKAQKDIVEVRTGGTVKNSRGDALDYSTLVEQLKQAKAALGPLQAQQERLTASIKLQESAVGGVKSSLQQLGSAANAAETALVQAGGNASRAMLEARLATEKQTAALREQAKAARDEVQARNAQGRFNSLLGVREPAAGSAQQSAAVFEQHLRTAKAIGQAAMEVGAAEAAMATSIGRAAREVGAAEAQMAQKAQLLKDRLDPLAAIQHRLNRELKEARDLYRSGHISAQELALAERVLANNAKMAADALERQGKGGRGSAGLFGLNSHEMSNLGYQVNDVFTQIASGTSVTQTMAQQGGQLLQIFPKVGSAIVSALTNPVILGSAATFGLIALSVKKIIDEGIRIRTLSGVLLSMGDGARYNAEALSDAAMNLDLFGMSAADALAVVRRFLREGLNPALIEDFGRAAQNMAGVLKIEVKAAAEQIAEGFSGSYDALARLDDSVNFLTVSEREHIRALYDSGRATEARAEAARRFTARMDEGASKARGSWYKAGRGLEKVWHDLLTGIGKTGPIFKATAAFNGLFGAIAGGLLGIKDMFAGIGEKTIKPGEQNTTNGPVIKPTLDTTKFDTEIADLRKRLIALRKEDRTLFSPDAHDKYDAALARIQARLTQLNQERKQFIASGGMAGGDPVDLKGNPYLKQLAEARADEAIGLKVVGLERELDEVRRRGNAARAAAIAGEIEYQRVLRQTHDTVKAQAARRLAEQQENNRTAGQQVQSGQSLLRTAQRYQGYNENNRGQRAALMEMFREAGIALDPGKLAWCAAFINAVLAANGLPTAKNSSGGPTTLAKDFKSYGSGVDLADAQPGDIIVLRPLARGTTGHVGLFSGFDPKGNVKLTAGNQDGSQAVSTDTFSRDKVVAVRRPGLPDQNAAFTAQLETQRAEQQLAFNESVDEENTRRARTAEQMKKLLGLSGEALFTEERRQAVENAIWAAERQAARQGLELSQERRKEIERTTGAEWDLAHARERATRPVDDLTSERRGLLDRITQAQKLGATEEMAKLEGELDKVDTALESAIGKAMDFWKQWDHSESRTAIAGLENLRRGLYEAEAEIRRQGIDQAEAERQAVLDRIAQARDIGATDELARLEAMLPGLDAKLKAAIESAEKFWKQFDIPEGRTAMQSLAGLRAGISQTAEDLQRANLERPFEQLRSQRAELQQQIDFFRGEGQSGVADQLKAQLRAIDVELVKAIDSLIKFWSQSTRPEAQATLLNLQNLRNEIIATQDEFRITAGDIQQAFAGSMTNAVVAWAEAIGEGRNAIRATWDAARQFAADFIRQLAMMLLQAAALKLAMKIGFSKVSNGMNSLLNAAPLLVASQGMKSAADRVIAGGATVGLGAASLAVSAASLMAAAQMLLVANSAGGASVMHTGGIVGSGGPSRAVHPAWFANAARFHTGGVIGLRPREIPIIAERGEEMLTRDDPRHILNGGGRGGTVGSGEPASITVVNAIDAGDFVSKGMNTRVGGRAVLNFIRANAGAVRAAMGGSGG